MGNACSSGPRETVVPQQTIIRSKETIPRKTLSRQSSDFNTEYLKHQKAHRASVAEKRRRSTAMPIKAITNAAELHDTNTVTPTRLSVPHPVDGSVHPLPITEMKLRHRSLTDPKVKWPIARIEDVAAQKKQRHSRDQRTDSVNPAEPPESASAMKLRHRSLTDPKVNWPIARIEDVAAKKKHRHSRDQRTDSVNPAEPSEPASAWDSQENLVRRQKKSSKRRHTLAIGEEFRPEVFSGEGLPQTPKEWTWNDQRRAKKPQKFRHSIANPEEARGRKVSYRLPRPSSPGSPRMSMERSRRKSSRRPTEAEPEVFSEPRTSRASARSMAIESLEGSSTTLETGAETNKKNNLNRALVYEERIRIEQVFDMLRDFQYESFGISDDDVFDSPCAPLGVVQNVSANEAAQNRPRYEEEMIEELALDMSGTQRQETIDASVQPSLTLMKLPAAPTADAGIQPSITEADKLNVQTTTTATQPSNQDLSATQETFPVALYSPDAGVHPANMVLKSPNKPDTEDTGIQPSKMLLATPCENTLMEDAATQPSQMLIANSGDQPSQMLASPCDDRPKEDAGVQLSQMSMLRQPHNASTQPSQLWATHLTGQMEDSGTQPSQMFLQQSGQDASVQPSRMLLQQPDQDAGIQPSQTGFGACIKRPSQDTGVQPSHITIPQCLEVSKDKSQLQSDTSLAAENEIDVDKPNQEEDNECEESDESDEELQKENDKEVVLHVVLESEVNLAKKRAQEEELDQLEETQTEDGHHMDSNQLRASQLNIDQKEDIESDENDSESEEVLIAQSCSLSKANLVEDPQPQYDNQLQEKRSNAEKISSCPYPSQLNPFGQSSDSETSDNLKAENDGVTVDTVECGGQVSGQFPEAQVGSADSVRHLLPLERAFVTMTPSRSSQTGSSQQPAADVTKKSSKSTTLVNHTPADRCSSCPSSNKTKSGTSMPPVETCTSVSERLSNLTGETGGFLCPGCNYTPTATSDGNQSTIRNFQVAEADSAGGPISENMTETSDARGHQPIVFVSPSAMQRAKAMAVSSGLEIQRSFEAHSALSSASAAKVTSGQSVTRGQDVLPVTLHSQRAASQSDQQGRLPTETVEGELIDSDGEETLYTGVNPFLEAQIIKQARDSVPAHLRDLRDNCYHEGVPAHQLSSFASKRDVCLHTYFEPTLKGLDDNEELNIGKESVLPNRKKELKDSTSVSTAVSGVTLSTLQEREDGSSIIRQSLLKRLPDPSIEYSSKEVTTDDSQTRAESIPKLTFGKSSTGKLPPLKTSNAPLYTPLIVKEITSNGELNTSPSTGQQIRSGTPGAMSREGLTPLPVKEVVLTSSNNSPSKQLSEMSNRRDDVEQRQSRTHTPIKSKKISSARSTNSHSKQLNEPANLTSKSPSDTRKQVMSEREIIATSPNESPSRQSNTTSELTDNEQCDTTGQMVCDEETCFETKGVPSMCCDTSPSKHSSRGSKLPGSAHSETVRQVSSEVRNLHHVREFNSACSNMSPSGQPHSPNISPSKHVSSYSPSQRLSQQCRSPSMRISKSSKSPSKYLSSAKTSPSRQLSSGSKTQSALLAGDVGSGSDLAAPSPTMFISHPATPVLTEQGDVVEQLLLDISPSTKPGTDSGLSMHVNINLSRRVASPASDVGSSKMALKLEDMDEEY